jgi:hypothetical protein
MDQCIPKTEWRMVMCQYNFLSLQRFKKSCNLTWWCCHNHGKGGRGCLSYSSLQPVNDPIKNNKKMLWEIEKPLIS